VQHATWSEIWRRRREWQQGFEQEHPSSDQVVARP